MRADRELFLFFKLLTKSKHFGLSQPCSWRFKCPEMWQYLQTFRRVI